MTKKLLGSMKHWKQAKKADIKAIYNKVTKELINV